MKKEVGKGGSISLQKDQQPAPTPSETGRSDGAPSRAPSLPSGLDEWWDLVSDDLFPDELTSPLDCATEGREGAPDSPSPNPTPAEPLPSLTERIEALRQQAATLCGGELLWGKTTRFPLEMEEVFWRQLIAFESAEPVEPFSLLLRAGVPLPPPPLLDELQLPDTLWELIYSLATIGCYLENTDHLSDRELYTSLWEDLLREPVILFPDNPNFACHFDLIGSGSEEDQQIYLQYYACEETRRRWRETMPHQHLPARRPRPWDRDRHLPRPYLRRVDRLM